MPVEFSTDERVARFGCFDEAPSQAELEILVRDGVSAKARPLIDTHLDVHGPYPFFLPRLTGLRPLRGLVPAGEGDET